MMREGNENKKICEMVHLKQNWMRKADQIREQLRIRIKKSKSERESSSKSNFKIENRNKDVQS